MQDSYREIFLSESQEYLNIISQCLVKLEQAPSDLESLNEIFRSVHTLKGMSATMGFEKVVELSHQMEDLLDALRSQKIKVSSAIVDALFNSLDSLEALIQEIKLKKKSEVDITPRLKDLQRFMGKKEKIEQFRDSHKEGEVITDSERKLFESKKNKGLKVFRIKIDLYKDCAMKQVRALLIVINLERVGQILKSAPSVKDLKQGHFDFSFVIFIATKESVDAIRHELLTISEVDNIEITPVGTSHEKQVASSAAPASVLKRIQSMRIPVERLDKIMNLMGELAIAKIRLVQIVQSEGIKSLDKIAFLLNRLTTALQDEIMQTRLLPVSYVLDTFPRIVRDLAKRQNKDIELEITGSEIELDRTILNEIGDPLVHLVRNAIDHGIEDSKERKQFKKNPRGKVSIKVVRQKGHITIEVADDGRGIDFDAVRMTALKRGLISEEEAIKLDREGVFNLLTLPGFSTSDKISEVSGRGVGLDVVKNKMDALTGRLEFETEPNSGTRFILTLPLTLAIIKAMLVKVCQETFAIPLMSIRETIKIKEEEIKMLNNFEVIRLRDEIIPIMRLDKKLDLVASDKSGQEQESKNGRISIVIVESGLKSMGLMVNKVLGQQDIVVKPLGSIVRRIKGIAGATILADARVALILDVMGLR